MLACLALPVLAFTAGIARLIFEPLSMFSFFSLLGVAFCIALVAATPTIISPPLEKRSISQSLLDDLTLYTKYSSAAYQLVCLSPLGNTLVVQVCAYFATPEARPYFNKKLNSSATSLQTRRASLPAMILVKKLSCHTGVAFSSRTSSRVTLPSILSHSTTSHARTNPQTWRFCWSRSPLQGSQAHRQTERQRTRVSLPRTTASRRWLSLRWPPS